MERLREWLEANDPELYPAPRALLAALDVVDEARNLEAHLHHSLGPPGEYRFWIPRSNVIHTLAAFDQALEQLGE